MGLFNSRQPTPPVADATASPIPVLPVDLTKRYDVYCTDVGHDRVYENIRFVCMRTFGRITEYSPDMLSGHLEIEAADGARWLIPSFGIRAICEHGVQPAFKVLRHRRRWDE